MPNFSTSHIGCWDNLKIIISAMFKYGHLSNIVSSKACDICKIKHLMTKLILLGHVNNYDENRYLELFSKAAEVNELSRQIK